LKVLSRTAPFIAEHVRRDIVARYGNQRLLEDGLDIRTTVDLDLEREAFMSLVGEEKTKERMQYMLMNGKPLRN
jgi:membrane carboxypeptidase/penicillin-binding protein